MANVRVLAVTMSIDGWMAGPDQGKPLDLDWAVRVLRASNGAAYQPTR